MRRIGTVLPQIPLKTSAEHYADPIHPRDCEVCNDVGWVAVAGLEPGDPMFGKAWPCWACPRGRRSLLETAGVPTGYKASLDVIGGWGERTAEQDMAGKLLDMISKNPQGFLTASGDHGVILMGGTGTGKTTMAVACLQRARWVRDATYVYWPDLLSRIKASYNKAETESEAHIMRRILTTQFLIVDDLGAGGETDTRLSLKIAEQIAETRTVDNALWTIITTNLDNDGIARHLSERVASRLTGRLACVPVTGPDMRGG